MAFTRSHLYPAAEQLISHFARAISHPARVCIIQELYKNGPCTVENLMKLHPISQPSLSQHLAILRKMQLLHFKEQFPYTYYSLNFENLRRIKHEMKLFLKKI